MLPTTNRHAAAWRALPTLAATIPAFACDAGSDASQDRPAGSVEYGVRDSAGVFVAENARPADGSRLGWTVSAEPLVSIGTLEGEGDWQLYRVRNATKLADGRIVVANGGTAELLVFDEGGEHVATWGGEGDGPGEFAELGRVVAWAGDSIMAADRVHFRVSVFDADGAHGRTTSLPGAIPSELIAAMGAAAAEGPTHVLLEALSDSLMLTWDSPIAMSGFQRQDHFFEIKRADGRLLASLGQYPGPQTYTATFNSESGVMLFVPLRHPFGHTTEWAAWGDLVAFGRTETYEIRAFRMDGSLARIVRRAHESGAATRAELDAHLEELLRGRADIEEKVDEIIAGVPMTEGPLPAFGPVRGDALGYLWVAEFGRPGALQTVWTVFDPEGVALGFVETPGGFDVYEIGADYILGRHRDETGTEYVQSWGLDRS